MENQEYRNCCTHYKTDEYLDGFVVAPIFKVKVCQNCGEVHLVCNSLLYLLFRYIVSWFWNGSVYVEDIDDNKE